ncbi:hypothetical protein [Macrococcus animalis]|uniref:hypothetical protein n=1 Tax=Macrococcus animalis TaxID=3395467 RepID=UPI0039BEAE53
MIETTSSIEWGTVLFSLLLFIYILLAISLLIYLSKRRKGYKNLDQRVRELEKRDKQDQL